MARSLDSSRPPSRMESRPPSRLGMDSRPSSRMDSGSRAPSMSRGASPNPSYYYANYNHSGSNSPVNSRSSTPVSSEYYRRSPSPLRTSYTDLLCTASRRLRERSIPPPQPLPERLEPVRPPIPTGKPPPVPSQARVVASDFYRGKVKSIYEREPLFVDFARTIPDRYGQVNIYNSGNLCRIKTDFKNMVEDKWQRMRCQDPSVEMNFGAKVYPWRDLAIKPHEPASARIFKEQSVRPRSTTPVNMPRIYVYHRSTMSPGPC